MTVRLAELPDINALEAAALSAPSGKPLLLPCDLIDEDPDQPRTTFDDESLRELAATIAERGVRQPVSVRQHPTVEGRWMLNFGARRLRASKLAGKTEIPAFVDDAVDSYDQVIENEQRQGLKPMELALFVKRRLDAGDSQAEVARRLGKSKAHISYVCALIDAPDWLLALYRSGRCTGAHELYDLRRLHAQRPQLVERAIAGGDSIVRAKIESLQEKLRKSGAIDAERERNKHAVSRTSGASAAPMSSHSAEIVSIPARNRGPLRLFAQHRGRAVEIVLLEVPDDAGTVFVCVRDGDARQSLPLADLQELRLQR